MNERIHQDTGLYQFTLFELLFNHEISRSRRYPSPLCLVRMALNYDGLSTAEEKESATLMAAHVLNTSLRQVDVPAHCEADFLILLPATDESGGLVVARRIRQRMAGEHTTRSGRRFLLDVWLGLAAHPGGVDISGAGLFDQATSALHQARQRQPNTLVNYRELVIVRD